jgi:phosphatidate cytidylyltransferase
MSPEHKKRWLTALIGVPFLIAVYFFARHWGIVALAVAISTVAYREFVHFSGASKTLLWISTGSAAALSLWLSLDFPGGELALYLAVFVILAKVLWQAHTQSPEELPKNFLYAQSRVFGLVYLVLFPSFIPKIHALPHGPTWMLFLMIVIWLGDTAAYYGGKWMGRTKLSINVSPGKTWEGALTALIACALMAIAFRYFSLQHLSYGKLALLAVLSSVVAQMGDLIESLMKRAYQVKDSGVFFPGHGGVFDRFDSLILAAPFFYLLVHWGT